MSTTSRNVYFIDAQIDEAASLLAGLPAESTVFLLNPLQDGIAQMLAALAGYDSLDAIHLLSHGGHWFS